MIAKFFLFLLFYIKNFYNIIWITINLKIDIKKIDKNKKKNC